MFRLCSFRRSFITGLALVIFSVPPSAMGQGTGFTYQGRLTQGGGPATGNCDFIFRLYDADAPGGTQIGSDEPKPNVFVNAGVFTVVLNSTSLFGAAAFNGNDRWLDTQVRCPAGGGSYATLAPRQQLTAEPYALQSRSTLAEYGDGSAGALTISSNTDWNTSPPASNNFQFSSVTVNAGQTWTIPSGLVLRVRGAFIVNGTITVAVGPRSTGSPATGLGIALSAATNSIGGIAISRLGASQLLPPKGGGGSGGGSASSPGGAGGGSLVVIAEGGITVAGGGSIVANGGNGGTNTGGGAASGGGGGGVIILASRNNITNGGTLSATGGVGGTATQANTFGGAGGGGGIVHFLSPNADVVAGTVNVNGGSAGGSTGTPVGGSQGGGASGGNGGDCPNTLANPATVLSPGATGLVIRTKVNDPGLLF